MTAGRVITVCKPAELPTWVRGKAGAQYEGYHIEIAKENAGMVEKHLGKLRGIRPLKLFVCITDDEWGLLVHFLRHYAAGGVNRFFIACPPALENSIQRRSQEYDVTTITDLDVIESVTGGVAAVTEMRRRYQDADEWVIIVDFDEFVIIDRPVHETISELDAEGVNVARGIMLDRFTSSGDLVGFTESDDLSKVFPIKARFNETVMNGTQFKGVFVKGHLPSAVAHHFFIDERVSARQFEIAHYRFHGRTLDRLRANLGRLNEIGAKWAIEYENILRHYDQNGRFAWETFGGWRDGLISTDCNLDGRIIRVWHRENTSDRVVLAQVFTRRDYDIPGCFLATIAAYHSRIVATGNAALIVDAGAHFGASGLWFGFKWPPCRIVGIEPNRDDFEVLASNMNLSLLDSKLYHAFLDKEDGTGILIDRGMAESGREAQRASAGKPTCTIGLGRVFAENAGYVPFVLKIDIEGHEQSLFEGDTSPIDAFPVVIVELHDWLMPERKSSVPFLRWHASRNRVFHVHGAHVISIDWEKLSSGPSVITKPGPRSAVRGEKMARNDHLVYDVGLHTGEDTEFYLKKGYHVVAFEANPSLAEFCSERFAQQIQSGQLHIVQGAIAPPTSTGKVKFYLNNRVSVWGTIDQAWVARNAALGSDSTETEVDQINMAEVFEKFGMPFYLKIDIEGADGLVLDALRNFEDRPQYISIEANTVDISSLARDLETLSDLGYKQFRLVPQQNIGGTVVRTRTLRGEPIEHVFADGASGVFGDELLGVWIDRDAVVASFSSQFDGWQDIHASLTADESANLALNRPATQSSTSQWSTHSNPDVDARVANNGDTGSTTFFHTAHETAPWWQVDLGADFVIEQLRIFNRRDAAERLRRFTVLVSRTGATGSWLPIYCKNDDAIFGHFNNVPLVIMPDARSIARFVRIRKDDGGYLHFCECEVLGYRPDSDELVSLSDQMERRIQALPAEWAATNFKLTDERSGYVTRVGVESLDFRRVEAIHPHWTGFLKLSNTNNEAELEGYDRKATYEIANETLTVFWEGLKPDVFLPVSRIYIHQDLLIDTLCLERVGAVKIRDLYVVARKISVELPGGDYEVILRLNTSDIPTFEQVFVNREYDSLNLPKSAEAIVDLGANIGLAAVFFGLRYPNARILCVEPETDNFTALVRNTEALGDRVLNQHAAVWTKDGLVYLHTESESSSPLGAWGVQVSDRKAGSSGMTKSCKMATLFDEAGFNRVDILKIDIEGAELEVFSDCVHEWLPRVDLIIIETHDRFRPGSDEAVRKAVHPMFEELPRCGENLFFRRTRR
ncbi:MAG TPA: FkbM family methyltransferase [Acetobacteraceae bacterium]|nr:FkbM family methyltransferase [Acetobacteraceae bacterium]